MKVSWRAALLWSTVATLPLFGMEAAIRSSTATLEKAVSDASGWLTLWPIFFVNIWVVGNFRGIRRWLDSSEARATVRATSGEASPVGATFCRKCGYPNPPVALECANCGLVLRTISVVHPVEMLPGAKRSATSLLYVLAFGFSFFAGVLAAGAVALIDRSLIENDALMIGTFVVAAFVAMIFSVEVIRRIDAWANRR